MNHLAKTRSLWISWVSVWLNVSLGILKCAVGLWVNSKALVADGLHSLVDLSTDIAAILGLTWAARPPDGTHPYGHQKFSSLATLFISMVLMVFCVGLIYTSVAGLVTPSPVSPEWPALAAAGLSLAVKEWLFWRTRAIARQERSLLVMANAWHHRTDSISSLVVFAALLAVILGGDRWQFLDKGVGLGLGMWLAVEAVKMLWHSSSDLLDAAPNEAVISDLREHILPVPGAVAYHNFRVRRVGDWLTVDLHLQVAPALTVAEGHEIARRVKEDILGKHPEVADVLVHVEPADARHVKQAGVHDRKPGEEQTE
jgi:cation diffusion facilitator family transporter